MRAGKKSTWMGVGGQEYLEQEEYTGGVERIEPGIGEGKDKEVAWLETRKECSVPWQRCGQIFCGTCGFVSE